jgi:hypothetical protein
MGIAVRNMKCVFSHVEHSSSFSMADTADSRSLSELVNSMWMFGRMACMSEYEHMESSYVYASSVTRISGVIMIEDITDLTVIG